MMENSSRAQPEPTVLQNNAPVSDDEAAPKHRARPLRRHRIIHSCLECRRRKRKCDRGDPCENCLASGEQCVYVNASTSDVQLRQRLMQIKEAKDEIDGAFRDNIDSHNPQQENKGSQRKRSRLSEEAQSDDSNSSADEGFLKPIPSWFHDATYANDADGNFNDLGFKVGRMRLGRGIGGLYRPRIADEIDCSLQHVPQRGSYFVPPTIVSIPAEELLRPSPSFTAPSLSIVFCQLSAPEPLPWSIPHRIIADKLLEQYWNAVHPVAQVLHRPSFVQRYEALWEAIEDGERVTPSLLAIVYSVLFSAVVSMSEEQVFEVCQHSRHELKNCLKLGVEASLGHAQWLTSTKIETLQAFVAYLMPMCVDEISRAHTVLTGMAIRLAECMGLHRDPSEYDFSPSECQVRRVIWYQICYLDLQTSEIHGPRPYIHHDGYTTQLPLDVASSSSPSPHSTSTWNDMIFSMIRFECQEMQRKCLFLRIRVDQEKIGLTRAISKIDAFRVSMDAKYGPYLNSVNPSPMQRMAQLVLKLFTNLMYLVPLHRHMNSITYSIPDKLRQIILTKGTEALEAAVGLESTPDLKQWSWYSGAYQQYHSALLLLNEVFMFPMWREANRIWCCLDFVFADALITIPPIDMKRGIPTLHDIIGHRDMKARYLLRMICDRMRVYRKAKGLKNPVQFEDSMIAVTPQKDGDITDPRLPLSHAYGEPESAAQAQNPPPAPNPPVPSPEEVDLYIGHLTSILPYRGGAISSQNNDTVDNIVTPLASSTGEFPLWIQYRELDPGVDSNTKLQPSYLPSSTSSASPNESLPTKQCVEVHGRNGSTDSQMLEIDWNLWDRMFPPQPKDGYLYMPDDLHMEALQFFQ